MQNAVGYKIGVTHYCQSVMSDLIGIGKTAKEAAMMLADNYKALKENNELSVPDIFYVNIWNNDEFSRAYHPEFGIIA